MDGLFSSEVFECPKASEGESVFCRLVDGGGASKLYIRSRRLDLTLDWSTVRVSFFG